MVVSKTVEKKEKSDKKIQELEGLVLANRFGAKTIWSGIMTILVSFMLFIVISIPIAAWVSTSFDVMDNRKIVILEGGDVAMIVMLAVIALYSVAMMVGTIRIGMGIYRMAHPEKYVDRVLGEK